MCISVFFTLLLAFVENPFAKLDFTPADGRGLNPILQSPSMAIHPPNLYLGYVGFSVPYAFAMAALITGRLGDEWIRSIRIWTLIPWLFLGVGLLLGAQWAYVELGWGGYWAWDPVENAALMPWLPATAFIHSIMIQEKKGMLKRWNMALIILTFFLSIFGTFMTRSGIISSVHTFAQSDIGIFFIGFIFTILVVSFGAFIARLDGLRSESRLDSMLSRESTFLFNNLILLGVTLSIFLGTIFPIISEAVRGEKILVGPPYFNRVNVPLGLALVFLMGIGPLISWRKATKRNLIKNFLYPLVLGVLMGLTLYLIVGIKNPVAIIAFMLCAFVAGTVVLEFSRGTRIRARQGDRGYVRGFFSLMAKNRRRYSGYIVHIGIVLIVAGITASSTFVTQKEATLKAGESIAVNGYHLRYEGLSKYQTASKFVTEAKVSIYNSEKKIATLVPQKNLYKYSGNREMDSETEVAIRSTLKEDLYVVLTGSEGDGSATIRILLNPMVLWIWIGGGVLALGGILSMIPGRKERKQPPEAKYSVDAERD